MSLQYREFKHNFYTSLCVTAYAKLLHKVHHYTVVKSKLAA